MIITKLKVIKKYIVILIKILFLMNIITKLIKVYQDYKKYLNHWVLWIKIEY